MGIYGYLSRKYFNIIEDKNEKPLLFNEKSSDILHTNLKYFQSFPDVF